VKTRQWLGIGFLFFAVFVIFAWEYLPKIWESMEGPRRTIVESPHRGEMAPDFTLREVDGRHTVALHDMRGKPVVIFFGSCT
jgi:hypothetical protein